jgi:hypothetical protein
MTDVSGAILAIQLLLAGAVGWVAKGIVRLGKESHSLKGELGKVQQSLYGPKGNPEIGIIGLLLELKVTLQELHDEVMRKGGADGRDRDRDH